jgi:hypothetical protein
MFDSNNIFTKSYAFTKRGSKWQSYCQGDYIHYHLQGKPYNIVPIAILKIVPIFFMYIVANKSPNDYNFEM